VIGRELTKTYESVYRLKKTDLKNIETLVVDKGEFVVLFHTERQVSKSAGMEKVSELMKDYLDNGGSPKKLAKIFSSVLDLETKVVYDQLTRSVK
jgi:16S rRNA (cytidine1402-2'-O)-methyltransferase